MKLGCYGGWVDLFMDLNKVRYGERTNFFYVFLYCYNIPAKPNDPSRKFLHYKHCFTIPYWFLLYVQTVSTNITYTTSIWLFMWKRHLRHSNLKNVKKNSRRNKNHTACAIKSLSFVGFYFGDFTLWEIFYKIQNFKKWQFVSVITHWAYTWLNPWALVFNGWGTL